MRIALCLSQQNSQLKKYFCWLSLQISCISIMIVEILPKLSVFLDRRQGNLHLHIKQVLMSIPSIEFDPDKYSQQLAKKWTGLLTCWPHWIPRKPPFLNHRLSILECEQNFEFGMTNKLPCRIASMPCLRKTTQSKLFESITTPLVRRESPV